MGHFPEINKITSGSQPCQLVKSYRRSRDRLCPLHSPVDGDRDGSCNVGINQLTRLIAQEDVINDSRHESYSSLPRLVWLIFGP